MGAVQSSQQAGKQDANSEMINKVDKMLNQLLAKHMKDFVDKKFCQKAKIFIRDDVLMKQGSTCQ